MKQIALHFTVFLCLAAFFAGCNVSPRPISRRAGRIISYTQCQLPTDQGTGSFWGSWQQIPIPLVFDNDFYTVDNGEIMTSFRAAVSTWNGWAAIKGRQVFDITNDGSGVLAGRTIPATNDCSTASYPATVTDVVGIWRIGTNDDHANVRATCGANTGGRLLPEGVQGLTEWVVQSGNIVGAGILLNFESWNAPGKPVIDQESLLLHELGHVLGLLHSCNGSGGGSIDGTSSPPCDFAPQAYLDAVMFPRLEEGQKRRLLEQNDYDRINCLY